MTWFYFHGHSFSSRSLSIIFSISTVRIPFGSNFWPTIPSSVAVLSLNEKCRIQVTFKVILATVSLFSYHFKYHIFVYFTYLRIITSVNDWKRDGECKVGGKLGVGWVLSFQNSWKSIEVWSSSLKAKVTSSKFFSLFLSAAGLTRQTFLEPSMKPQESILVWSESFCLVEVTWFDIFFYLPKIRNTFRQCPTRQPTFQDQRFLYRSLKMMMWSNTPHSTSRKGKKF